MPKRTDEERSLIESLPVLKPDKKCNARTGNSDRPYCQNTAGYGTEHVGTGRCKFHGGASNGRPAMLDTIRARFNGLTLQEDYDKIANDPNLVNMRSELAATKTLVAEIIKTVTERLRNDGFENAFIDEVITNGNIKRDLSAEVKTLFKALELLNKIYRNIVQSEREQSSIIDTKELHSFIALFKEVLDIKCGDCPVRLQVSQEMMKLRLPSK